MDHPFLITGLPRSRTAWMAVAATTDESLCEHEPLAKVTGWRDVMYTTWHRDGSYPYAGASDHALGFHLREIMETLAPRTLIIERPILMVEASLGRMGVPRSNFCTLLQEALAYEHPNIRRVPYRALSVTQAVIDCLEWLMPGLTFNVARIAYLQRLNIQAHLPAVMRDAERGAAYASTLLGPDAMTRLRIEA